MKPSAYKKKHNFKVILKILFSIQKIDFKIEANFHSNKRSGPCFFADLLYIHAC